MMYFNFNFNAQLTNDCACVLGKPAKNKEPKHSPVSRALALALALLLLLLLSRNS
jgi:hypothetical protein